jgi:cell division septation protein DedD
MRDLERVKDKIEIRLEPRQVVTLGVATAVFSGVLFAAGYWTGHRQRPEGGAPTGDLARLDAAREGRNAKVSALGDVEFLFPSVVAAGPSRGGPEQVPVRVPAIVVQPSASAEAALPPLGEVPAVPGARGEGTPDPKALTAATTGQPPAPLPPDEAEPSPPATTPRAVEPEPPPPPDEDEPRRLPALTAPPAPATQAPAPATRPPAPTTAAPAPATKAPAPATKAPAAASDGQQPGGRYTLQIKAVKDKAEAEAYAEKVRAAGLTPSTITVDVPGKGRVYRIRVGRFGSIEAARRFQRTLRDRTGITDAGFVTDH